MKRQIATSIPTRIDEIDDKIQKIIIKCYYYPEKRRHKCFRSLFNACSSDMLKDELRDFWHNVPRCVTENSMKESDTEATPNAQQDVLPDKPLVSETDINKIRQYIKDGAKVTPMSVFRKFAQEFDKKDLAKFLLNFYSSTSRRWPSKAFAPIILNSGQPVPKNKRHHLTYDIKRKIQKVLYNGVTEEKVFVLFESFSANYNTFELAEYIIDIYKSAKYIENFREKCRQENLEKSEKLTKPIKDIPWEAIVFFDQYIRFYDFIYDEEKNLKVENGYYSLVCKESRSSYNIIKPHFQHRLPQIKAYMEGNRVTQLVSNMDILDAIRILESGNNTEDVIIDNSPIISTSHFKTAFSSDQIAIKGRIRAAKSIYFEKLLNMPGVDQYRIVPCTEILSHATNLHAKFEDAFIFTRNARNPEDIILIFENVNEARATIKFYASKEKYETALKCVFDFMNSFKDNKRQLLKWRRVHFHNYGITRYECINHTYPGDWICHL